MRIFVCLLTICAVANAIFFGGSFGGSKGSGSGHRSSQIGPTKVIKVIWQGSSDQSNSGWAVAPPKPAPIPVKVIKVISETAPAPAPPTYKIIKVISEAAPAPCPAPSSDPASYDIIKVISDPAPTGWY